MEKTVVENKRSSSHNAVIVGSGIFLSKVIGLVRERIFAHYFGSSYVADAFKAALKAPNFLQNLFGEGALSSSFIPVYSRLLAEKNDEEASRVARAVGSILALVMSILVLVGVLATPFLIDFIVAPGFEGEKRILTIRIVQIMFPGMGVLVLAAWCLGILNSHRNFFLPYAASMLWSLAMIGALLRFGGSPDLSYLAIMTSWGSVIGSVLQFAVQLPTVIRLAGSLRFQMSTTSSNVREVVRNFIPGMAGRGVNQISSYIDTFLASPLPTGAVAALAYAQTIYLIPVSLFGMSVSNAELPEMASQTESGEKLAAAIRNRLNDALRRVSFFAIPSAIVFIVLGDSIVAFLFRTGRFLRNDVSYVWMVLAGYSIGLPASTLGRLYSSAFWALRDTRTPFRFASVRVTIAASLGWFLAFPVARSLGIQGKFGLVGLTIAAGFGAWIEFGLLRTTMNKRIGSTGIGLSYATKLLAISVIAAGIGFGVKILVGGAHPLISGALVMSAFGIVYMAGAILFKMPAAMQMLSLVKKRI